MARWFVCTRLVSLVSVRTIAGPSQGAHEACMVPYEKSAGVGVAVVAIATSAMKVASRACIRQRMGYRLLDFLLIFHFFNLFENDSMSESCGQLTFSPPRDRWF